MLQTFFLCLPSARCHITLRPQVDISQGLQQQNKNGMCTYHELMVGLMRSEQHEASAKSVTSRNGSQCEALLHNIATTLGLHCLTDMPLQIMKQLCTQTQFKLTIPNIKSVRLQQAGALSNGTSASGLMEEGPWGRGGGGAGWGAGGWWTSKQEKAYQTTSSWPGRQSRGPPHAPSGRQTCSAAGSMLH